MSRCNSTSLKEPLNDLNLKEADPEIYNLIKAEEDRQQQGIELIASENLTSTAVMECLGSCLTNKYSEGQPGNRYYGGNEVIDKIEILCQSRALKAFNLDENIWGANVQPYSGSPANFALYTALLNPHDRVMGLDLPSGGHLSHGFYSAKRKVSATSVYFESLPYKVDQQTGLLDMDDLRYKALAFKPKLIICGYSAYSRDVPFLIFRQIADEVGALLLCDMAHFAGLVATSLLQSPFSYADAVTTTTHKTLRGPRSGIIFYNKTKIPNAKTKIDNAVFPGLQGGPHNHQIAAVAAQLKQVCTPEFKIYSENVLKNSKALSETLTDIGFKIVTGGTDNHMLLIDLKPMGLSGDQFELVCEKANISLNKNTIPGDVSALNPSGVRIGTPCITTRGMNTDDCKQIAQFLKRVADICVAVQSKRGKSLLDFSVGIEEEEEVIQLRNDIIQFAKVFPIPGKHLD